MTCLYPRILHPSSLGKEVVVPCGKCINCRINRKREWTQRLMHESYFSSSSYFITLTYDEQHVPFDDNGNMAVSYDDVQKFHKRLRRKYPDVKVRYFVGSEYGDEGRPHYHGIYFNLPDDILKPCKDYVNGMPLIVSGKGSDSYCNRALNDIWQLGFCTIGELTETRVGYAANYFVDRKNVDDILQPNFNVMSRRPGIGYRYQESIRDKVRGYDMHGCMTSRGTYINLPRYYDKKIYSDEERHDRIMQYDQTDSDAYALAKSLHPDDWRGSSALRQQMRYEDRIISDIRTFKPKSKL